MTLSTGIGARARALREARGASVDDVANAAGVSMGDVERFESGVCGTGRHLDAMARALGVGHRRLLTGEEPAASVAADPRLAAALRGTAGRGVADAAEVAFHDVVQVLDDASRVLGLAADGSRPASAAPRPARPEAPPCDGPHAEVRRLAAGLIADAHVHGLVTAGKMREAVATCLGDAGAAFADACAAAAEEADEARMEARRAAALADAGDR